MTAGVADRPCLDVELRAVPEAVPELRRAVGAYVAAEVRAEAELCVTELVANVLRHVGEGTPVRVRVRVRAAGGGVRIEVTDPAAHALPVLRHAALEDECGRGLSLVDAVARRWGVEGGGGGKTVWCEVGGVH